MSQSDHSDTYKLVTVTTFPTTGEANLAKTALEQEGISSYLECENVVDTMWHMSNAVGGVKLKVAASDHKSAREFLGEIKQKRDNRHSRENAEDLYETEINRAFKAAIFGIVFLPVILHAISLGLLLQIPGDHIAVVSPSAKRRYYIAFCIDILVAIFLFLFILSRI